MFDHDYARVDLTMLGDLVGHAIGDVHFGIEQLHELCKDCDKAVQQRGNQAAWHYVDLLSVKMMEMSQKLAKDSRELRELLAEKDRYNDWLEKDRIRQMEDLRHLLEDEKIK